MTDKTFSADEAISEAELDALRESAKKRTYLAYALAALAFPQTRDGLRVFRVACQVEAAEALHGKDAALAQKRNGARDEPIALLARASPLPPRLTGSRHGRARSVRAVRRGVRSF